MGLIGVGVMPSYRLTGIMASHIEPKILISLEALELPEFTTSAESVSKKPEYIRTVCAKELLSTS